MILSIWIFFLINLHFRRLVSIGCIRLLCSSNCIVLNKNLNYGLSLTGFDVIHSLGVPSLGIKIDAIPGRINYINITAITEGIYYGQCTELCGSLHSFMPLKLIFI